jgi:hypothetical protein
VDPADQSHQPDPGADGSHGAQQVRDQDRSSLTAIAPFFRFSQLEFPWTLGPPDGRYLLRDRGATADEPAAEEYPSAGPSHVLVIATLGAPERRNLIARRRTKIEAEAEPEPSPVSTGRTTVITVDRSFESSALAAEWLSSAGEDELLEDLGVLNRALHSFRLVSADPYASPVGRDQALVARIGYGAGEQVADGLWTEARELVPALHRQRRAKVLAPQARLAALLAGRERPLACEELALRARLDLDHGRDREAALQVVVALDAAIAELAVDPTAPLLGDRLDELREYRDPVAVAGQSALEGAVSAEDRATVQVALERIEAALRARAVANSGLA